MKRNNTRRGSIDPPCCDHDAAAHLILSSSLAAKRRQEQRQKEEEENETQRDEERDLISSIDTTSMISRFLFSWNVRISLLIKRENRERERCTPRASAFSLSVLSGKKETQRTLFCCWRETRERERQREEEGITSSSSIVTHSSL